MRARDAKRGPTLRMLERHEASILDSWAREWAERREAGECSELFNRRQMKGYLAQIRITIQRETERGRDLALHATPFICQRARESVGFRVHQRLLDCGRLAISSVCEASDGENPAVATAEVGGAIAFLLRFAMVNFCNSCTDMCLHRESVLRPVGHGGLDETG